MLCRTGKDARHTCGRYAVIPDRTLREMLFGTTPPRSRLECRLSFRRRAKVCHPDKSQQHGMSEEQAKLCMQDLNMAREVILREIMAEQDSF